MGPANHRREPEREIRTLEPHVAAPRDGQRDPCGSRCARLARRARRSSRRAGFPSWERPGPLEAVKGHVFFLGAAQRVAAAHPETEFLVAGAGPEEENLRRLARELGINHNVTFASNLYDFSASLAAMDIFCLPSLRQGLGTIMLEAMALGRPVIASGVGGIYSVVRNNETGLVVPPSDSAALAERILELSARSGPRAGDRRGGPAARWRGVRRRADGGPDGRPLSRSPGVRTHADADRRRLGLPDRQFACTLPLATPTKSTAIGVGWHTCMPKSSPSGPN